MEGRIATAPWMFLTQLLLFVRQKRIGYMPSAPSRQLVDADTMSTIFSPLPPAVNLNMYKLHILIQCSGWLLACRRPLQKKKYRVEIVCLPAYSADRLRFAAKTTPWHFSQGVGADKIKSNKSNIIQKLISSTAEDEAKSQKSSPDWSVQLGPPLREHWWILE